MWMDSGFQVVDSLANLVLLTIFSLTNVTIDENITELINENFDGWKNECVQCHWNEHM